MNRTLELAISKVAQLPDAAQKQMGLELLDRVATLKELQAELEIGIRELDAGLGRPLDAKKFLKRMRSERGSAE